MKVPVRVWLKEREDLEGSCLEQAYHLSQLPFLSQVGESDAGYTRRKGNCPLEASLRRTAWSFPMLWAGHRLRHGLYGANIRVADIREVITGNGSLIQAIVGDIMRNVPVGFAHHKTMMPSYTMDCAFEEMDRYEEDAELLGQLEAGYYQIGTLGGGNHFIELQEDDDGYLAVDDSLGKTDHFGKSVCDYFHYKARLAKPDMVQLCAG